MSRAECEQALAALAGSHTAVADLHPDDFDSTVPVQEYLQCCVRNCRTDAARLAALPAGVDADLWAYEHMRQLCVELGGSSGLVRRLSAVCTAESCPEMMVLEWKFLCAVHGPAAETSPSASMSAAYSVHQLNAAILTLANPRLFPSRAAIPAAARKELTSIARRLYRIFAHAYYHHRAVFDAFERESRLFARLCHLNAAHRLIQAKLLIIP
ncbi:putative cell cycle-associated protein, partial [Ramicandelaber brevisporus]